jgi:hypothetical protein
VQALLAEAQLERWPRFERALRRDRSLPLGRFAGESTDLVGILDGLEVETDDPAALVEAVDAYELRLHQALLRRDELLESADGEIDAALFAGDGREALRWADRTSRARAAVRAINDEFTSVIASALVSPGAETFRQRALEASYPRVYRATIADQAFAAVEAITTLDDATRSAVGELHAAYAEQAALLAPRIQRAVQTGEAAELRHEIEGVIDLIESGGAVSAGSAPSELIAEAFQQRQALDARTMRTLYAIVPAEHRSGLPPVPVTEVGDPVRAGSSTGSFDPDG